MRARGQSVQDPPPPHPGTRKNGSDTDRPTDRPIDRSNDAMAQPSASNVSLGGLFLLVFRYVGAKLHKGARERIFFQQRDVSTKKQEKEGGGGGKKRKKKNVVHACVPRNALNSKNARVFFRFDSLFLASRYIFLRIIVGGRCLHMNSSFPFFTSNLRQKTGSTSFQNLIWCACLVPTVVHRSP